MTLQHIDDSADPGDRIGAWGAMRSVYVRNPDGNLGEIALAIADPPQTSKNLVQ